MFPRPHAPTAAPCLLAVALAACASITKPPEDFVDTDGLIFWIDGVDPRAQVVHMRNDTELEVHVVSVDIYESINTIQTGVVPMDSWLKPGASDSLRIDVRSPGEPVLVRVYVNWEKITRTKVEKEGKLGPPRPELGPPVTEKLPDPDPERLGSP